MKTAKGFKKDFDSLPSSLMKHPPSSRKSTPFKPMVANWWLEDHPNAEILEGARQLDGSYGRLKEDDLHPIDQEHIEELVVWHEKKARGSGSPLVGASE